MRFALLSLVLFAGTLFLAPETAFAGSVTGPKRGSQKINARANLSLEIEFRGGEVAEFGIVGDGDTDVDIFIFDANGQRITQDLGLSDLGLVRWTPPRTQRYRIELRNLGDVWNLVHYGYN